MASSPPFELEEGGDEGGGEAVGREDGAPPPVLQMPCARQHVFHRTCLLTWLRTRNTCPVCRHPLPTEDPPQAPDADAAAAAPRAERPQAGED